MNIFTKRNFRRGVMMFFITILIFGNFAVCFNVQAQTTPGDGPAAVAARAAELQQKLNQEAELAGGAVQAGTGYLVGNPTFANLPGIRQAVGALASKYAAKNVELKWNETLLLAAYMGITQAIQSFVTRLAYDSAVYLAAGGKGEGALAYKKGFGAYMADVGNDSAGFFLQGLGDILGVDLCKPPTMALDLALRLGLIKGKYYPSKPTCTLTQFMNNWKQVGSSRYWSNMASNFNFSIKPDQSDLGIYLDASAAVDKKIKQDSYGAEKQRQEGQGINYDATDLITGNIKTPAAVLKKEFENQSASEKGKVNIDIINASMSTGMKDLLYYVPGVFLNTFLSQTLGNFMNKGMLFGYCVSDACKKTSFTWPNYPEGLLGGGSDGNNNLEDDITTNPDATPVRGRAAVEAMFSDLLAAPVSSIDDYNLVNLFSTCPANPTPDNCIMDYPLAAALQEYNSTGRYLTIAQAMERELLHENFKLIPPASADDSDPNCYMRNYCYSNIKKMRQARMLPLGFEIAAKNSNADAPWTLGEVVAKFNECTYGSDGKVVYSPKTPFCHLINPNWVLKVEQHRCNAMVYGHDTDGSGQGMRSQECADLQGCVGKSADGKSCQSYGYCLKEKNVWQFDADKCSEQYASCVGFTNNNNQSVAYLYRTLDTTDCNADTNGCLAYSLSKDSNGVWQTPTAPSAANDYQNTGIYFNKKVSTDCSASGVGCSAFTAVSNDASLYLKKAPSYLGCYDADPATPGVDWPNSLSQINGIWSGLPTWKQTECKKYAAPCIAAEENCNMYTDAVTSDSLPGKFYPAEVANGLILNWNDQCDAKCVGYAAYKEMSSNYSNGQDLAYIVPSSGSTCSAQDEGCSAFTNLSAISGQMEKVEYYSYLRPCIKPDQAESGKYFTYEGSQTEGYQLKTYTLESDTTGESDPSSPAVLNGPKYFYRTTDDLAKFRRVCNAEVYAQGSSNDNWDDSLSPDCRQFTDSKGHIYYRILSHTVPVSLTCTPYRLNNTELEVMPSASTTQAQCTVKKGFWNNDHCELCFNNGEYKDGLCFYSGLPAGENNTAGVSASCSAAAETCRAYKGNAGNNIKNIFYDRFEDSTEATAMANWSAAGTSASLAVAKESTKSGEHSVTVYSGTSVALNKSLVLTPGKSYDLSFWAKGTATGGGNLNINVTLSNDANRSFGSVSAADSWRYYHLGPIELGGNASSTILAFTIPSGGRLYLDNVKLVEVTDYIYLVKKTLSVDPICDSNQLDNLPGEALGCRDYKTTSGSSYYLTNFSYLCREEAVGCTKVLDLYNTPSDSTETYYNVWLSNNGTSAGTLSVSFGTKKYSCSVEQGKPGCYTNIFGQSYADITSAAVSKNNTVISPTVSARINTSTIHIAADTAPIPAIYLVANSSATCSSADLGCTIAGKQKLNPSGQYTYTDVYLRNDPVGYFGAENSAGTLCTERSLGCGTYTSAKGTLYFKDPSVVGGKICSWQTRVEADSGNTYYGWFWKNVGKCSNSSGFCSTDSDCTNSGTCVGINSQPCYPDYLVDGTKYDLWSYGTTGNKYKGFVGECPVAQSGCTELVDHNDCSKGNCSSYYLLYNDKLKAAQANCNGQASLSKGCVMFDQTDVVNKDWNTAASYALSNRQNGDKVAPVSSSTNDANIIIQAQYDRACSEWVYCRLARYIYNEQTGKKDSQCYSLGVCDKFTPSSGDSRCAHDITYNRSDFGAVITDRDLVGLNKKYTNYLTRDITWGGPEYTGYSMYTYDPKEIHLSPADYDSSQINASTAECRGYPEADSPFPITVFKDYPVTATSSLLKGYENVKFCDYVSTTNRGKDCDCSYQILNFKSSGGKYSKTVYWPSTDRAPFDFTNKGISSSDNSICDLDPNASGNSVKYILNGYTRAIDHDCASGGHSCSFVTVTSSVQVPYYFPGVLNKDYTSPKKINYTTPPTCVCGIKITTSTGSSVSYYDCASTETDSSWTDNSVCAKYWNDAFIGDVGKDCVAYFYAKFGVRFANQDDCIAAAENVETYTFNDIKINTDATDEELSSSPVCMTVNTRKEVLGWKGYCMEYDLRRKVDGTVNKNNPEYACLSWLPVSNPGNLQNANLDTSIGNTGDLPPARNIGLGSNRYKCVENHYDQNQKWYADHGLGSYTDQITFSNQPNTKMFGYNCSGNGAANNSGIKFPGGSNYAAITADSSGDFTCRTQGTNAVVTYNHPYGKLNKVIATGTMFAGGEIVTIKIPDSIKDLTINKFEIYLLGNDQIKPSVVVFDLDKIGATSNGITSGLVQTLTANDRSNVLSRFDKEVENVKVSQISGPSYNIPTYAWRGLLEADNAKTAQSSGMLNPNLNLNTSARSNPGYMQSKYSGDYNFIYTNLDGNQTIYGYDVCESGGAVNGGIGICTGSSWPLYGLNVIKAYFDGYYHNYSDSFGNYGDILIKGSSQSVYFDGSNYNLDNNAIDPPNLSALPFVPEAIYPFRGAQIKISLTPSGVGDKKLILQGVNLGAYIVVAGIDGDKYHLDDNGFCQRAAKVTDNAGKYIAPTWLVHSMMKNPTADYTGLNTNLSTDYLIMPWTYSTVHSPFGLTKDLDFPDVNSNAKSPARVLYFDIRSSTARKAVNDGYIYESGYEDNYIDHSWAGLPLYISSKQESAAANPLTSDWIKLESANGSVSVTGLAWKHYKVNLNCSSFSDSGGLITPTAGNIWCYFMNRMFLRVYGMVDAFVEDSNPAAEGLDKNIIYKNSSAFTSIIDNAAPEAAGGFLRYPPIVAGVDLEKNQYSNDSAYNDCKDKGQNCLISSYDSISINGKSRGDVVVKAGAGVTMRFYAWAHPRQMAIKKMRISFGDNTPANKGSLWTDFNAQVYPNYKPSCVGSLGAASVCSNYPELSCSNDSNCKVGESTGSCVTITDANRSTYFNAFGSTPDTGCMGNGVEYSYIYQCSPPTTNIADIPENDRYPKGPYAIMKVGADRNKPYEIEISDEFIGSFVKTGDIVCAYRPKVQLIDSWGWCNGDCHSTTKSTPARGNETGCYNYPNGTQECSNETYLNNPVESSGLHPYTPFAGRVIVLPAEKF